MDAADRTPAASTEALESMPVEGAPKRSTVRRVVTVILVVLAIVGTLGTTAAFWIHARLLDSDTYVAVIGPVLEDPVVTDALGEYIADEIIEAVNLEGRLEERLSAIDEYLAERIRESLGLGDTAAGILGFLDLPGFADLAPPLAAMVESPFREAVSDVVGSERFREVVLEAVVVAHTKAVALLRGDYDEVSVVAEGDEVRLDLVPAIAFTLRALRERGRDLIGLDREIPLIPVADTPEEGLARLAEIVGVDLPSDFGQIVVMRTDQLEELQSGMRRLDRFPPLFLIVTLVFIAGALAVSTARVRTAAHIILGVGAGLFVALVALRRLEGGILNLITDPDGRATAQRIVSSTLGSLRATLIVLMGVAFILGIVVLLSQRGYLQQGWQWVRGKTEHAPGGSSAQRFAAKHADLLQIIGLVVAGAVLFMIGIGWPALILAVFLALYLWFIAGSRRAASTAPPPDRND